MAFLREPPPVLAARGRFFLSAGAAMLPASLLAAAALAAAFRACREDEEWGREGRFYQSLCRASLLKVNDTRHSSQIHGVLPRTVRLAQ